MSRTHDHTHAGTQKHALTVEFYDDTTFKDAWAALKRRRVVPFCEFKDWMKAYFNLKSPEETRNPCRVWPLNVSRDTGGMLEW